MKNVAVVWQVMHVSSSIATARKYLGCTFNIKPPA